MYNDNNYGFTKKRTYKKRGYIKQIILYFALAAFSLYLKSWKLAGIFFILGAVYIFIHIKNKDKIDSNLLSQGFYQLTHGEGREQADMKAEKEEERKKTFQDYLQQVEKDFDDDELDAELYGDYTDGYREDKE